MQCSGARGNKPIKVVEERRARKVRLERVGSDAAESRKTQDAKDQLYQPIMENAYVATTQIDKNYKILMVNNVVGRWIDKSAGEHIGRKCFREFEKRRSVCPHCPGKRAMETGRPAQAQTERVRDDGSRFPVRIQAFPTLDQDGLITGFIEIAEDLTERKRAEEARRESEEKYHSIFNTVANLIMSVDAHGVIVDCNARMKDILGYERHQFMGQSIAKIIHPDYMERAKTCLREVLVKGLARHEQYKMITKGNKVIDVEINATGIQDQKGKYVGALCIIEDITGRKRAEEAYHSLVDHSLQGLAIFQDGRVVFANQAMAQITGHSVEEMLAAPPEKVQAFVHPDDRELVWNRHRARLNGEELPTRYEFRGIRKDGSTCWLELDVNRIEYEGKPAIQAAYIDITERKQTEQMVRESEERHRAIVEQAADSIVLIDVETGELLEFNDTAYENLGYTREEFQRLKIPDFEVVESAAEVAGHIERIVREGRDTFETKHRTKDGRIRDIQVSSRAISIGGRDFVQSIWRDITKRKRAEEERLAYQVKLAHASRLSTLGEMASSFAHELNQPLCAIQSCADLCLRAIDGGRKNDDKIKDNLRTIETQAERAGNIIRHIRAIAKRQEPHQSTVDINTVVQGAVSLMDSEIRYNDIKLNLEFSNRVPAVFADKILLEQVLVNLIRNAIDAMAECEPEKRKLTIRTSQNSSGAVEVAVRDNGCGLAPEVEAQLFDAFLTTKEGGLGMGLSISRSIIEMHGGEIRGKPNSDGGCTFAFTVPKSGPGL